MERSAISARAKRGIAKEVRANTAPAGLLWWQSSPHRRHRSFCNPTGDTPSPVKGMACPHFIEEAQYA